MVVDNRRAAPADYPDEERAGFNWPDALRTAGYTPIGPAGIGETHALHYALWLHDSGHLMVEVWDMDLAITRFFVAADDVAAFLIDKYPPLVTTTLAAQKSQTDRSLLKALLAAIAAA